MSDKIAKRVFVASVSAFVFGVVFSYGFAVGKYQAWPYIVIDAIYTAAKSLLRYGEIAPQELLITAPKDSSRQIFTIYQPDKIIPGYYVFLGWSNENKIYSAWLYNHKGILLHTWEIDYTSLDPDGPLNDSDMPHGFKVLDDGSIIVSFDNGDVLTRLDACSKPIWINEGVYHHSIERAEDGSYWTWRAKGTGYGHYNTLVNFDPITGESIREIELVEDIIKNMGPSAAIFGVRPSHNFLQFKKTPPNKEQVDLFHPNDIDTLFSNLANKFPSFEAGDLLLSFRNIHLVAVLDPDTKTLKWWSIGPWRFQHDPDFTEDGKISVYSNNTGSGRSEIIKIDPTTKEFTNDLYYGNINFYSHSMGKHQYLPNGNVLIVVPEQGRVVEVSSDGNKILEFNNIVSTIKNTNAHVENGLWLPMDYFTMMPECVDLQAK